MRFLSYIDDTALTVSSRSLAQNCQILQQAAQWLFEKGKSQFIQFDRDKIDLIHFHSKRKVDLEQITIRLTNIEIASSPIIKWLGIHLDSKLLFYEHMRKKIAEATRVFYQIERLSNTERGLSFQAIRQLYIACIIFITSRL